MDNNSISQVFADVAVLLQAKGENIFKVRAHSKAADEIKSLPYPIADIAHDNEKLGAIPGFGELFRMLSYQSIKTSALQSRCTAGVTNGTFLFALPGSTGACKDGWDDILQYQLDIRHKPCNFIEIMPRLNEK